MSKPIESVVRARQNGTLIATAAQLWIKDTDSVLDVTWGQGKFWTHFTPKRPLRVHDLYTVDGVDFRNLPEADNSVDVLVFDPPYVSIGGRKTSTIHAFNDRYGLIETPSSPAELAELIGQGLKECARVVAPGGRVFVKTADYISSGKFTQGHLGVLLHAKEAGLVQVDEFILHSGCGPQPLENQDGTPRRQVHSRRAHSFLCIFQKPLRGNR